MLISSWLRPAARFPFSSAFLSVACVLSGIATQALAGVPPAHAPAKPSSLDSTLQQRLDAEQSALKGQDTDAIIAACKSLLAYGLYAIGTARAREGAFEEATGLYQTSLRLQPDEATQAALDRVLKSHGTQPRHAAETSEAAGAREYRVREVLATGYDDWGTALARQQKFRDALTLFNEAAHWNPLSLRVQHNLGMAAFRTGDYGQSAQAFEAVLQQQPDDQEARLLLGLALFSSERFREAAAAFAPLAASITSNSRAAYAYAFSLARINEPQQANAILDQLSATSLPAEELAMVCQVYGQTENYEHAVSCLQHAAALDPTLRNVHYEAGVALIHLSRPADAIPELRKELALDSDNANAEFYLGYALLETSQKPEAKTMLSAAVAGEPDNAQAQYQLGKLLLEEGEGAQAIAHLEAAARAAPDDYYVHYQLQSAYRKAGRADDAARELKIYQTIKAKHREDAAQTTVEDP